MAIYERIFVFGICIYLCLITDVDGSTKSGPRSRICKAQRCSGTADECTGTHCPATQTTESTTSSFSPTTTQTTDSTTTSFSTTKTQTTGSTTSSFSSSSTDTMSTSGQPYAAFKESSRGSTTAATAAGVSVAVALVVAVGVIVLVLRSKGQLCFASTKDSRFVNTDDNHHISLARVESKPNAYLRNTGAPVPNHSNSGLPNRGGCSKPTDEYYAVVDNDISTTDSKQNVVYQTPGAPVSTHTYSGLQKGNGGSQVYDAPAEKGIFIRNIYGAVGNPDSANSYFILEKEGFRQPTAVKSPSADVHDYLVLEKQQNGQENGDVPFNEGHPYCVLEKHGGVQTVHERPSNDANPYFLLETQTADVDKLTPSNAPNVAESESDDGDMFQEIDTNNEYAGIDDSRDDDNNEYDYTNKAFRDSKVEVSDNIYNKLNTEGDEYDHVRVGNDCVSAAENEYDVRSTVVRK